MIKKFNLIVICVHEDHVIYEIVSDDIQDEVSSWESYVVCYILGANPLKHVAEGFLRRVWGKMGINKLLAIDRVAYKVRFLNEESRDSILAMGFHFLMKHH